MDVVDLIKKATQEGKTSLNEAESKQVLHHYGVPVVEELVVRDVDEAVAKAESVGFPVVLKGLGARLTHKTERGFVRLNLKGADDVRQAAREIAESAGDDLEGFIVCRMISGKREFVAGMFRDDQFGPVIMFGLGGILTEALGDVVFRIAPLDATHANAMMDELRAAKLLGSFRGEQALHREQMIQVLTGLSRLALEHPEIKEVDINPLLVDQDGKITAVDALVVLGASAMKAYSHLPVDSGIIWQFFHPRSIAFVGASADFGKWGYVLFTNVAGGGYEGKIYLVNPKGGEIAGRAVFKSVTDIPDTVDLAVVVIPAAKVQELIPEFKAKGIRKILLITSGYGETGEEGRLLEQQLAEAARAAGIIIMGPNTMGIFNPHEKLYCTFQHVRPKPGYITLVSQSGNLGTQLMGFAEHEQVGLRAFAGTGNEAMITIEDFMEGLEHDDVTNTVALYLESVKDGRRFFETAKRISSQKPIVAIKGGRTLAGKRAAASHTGAMASNNAVFEAACKQSGIVLGKTTMDLLDLSAAFSYLPLPAGKRIAMLTLGGGWGVLTSDLLLEYGLEVPDLSPELKAKIDQILPPYWSHTNPVDTVAEMDPEAPLKLSEALISWDGCDVLLHLGMLGRRIFIKNMVQSVLAVDQGCDRAALNEMSCRLSAFDTNYTNYVVKLMEKYGKPVLGVSLFDDEDYRIVTDVEGTPHKGITFPTPERAVKVIAAMYSYKRWLDIEGHSSR